MVFCVDIKQEFENLKDECGLLNEYIIEGRYPGDLPFESIGEDDAKEAIEAAEKIEEYVLENINLPSDNEKTFQKIRIGTKINFNYFP